MDHLVPVEPLGFARVTQDLDRAELREGQQVLGLVYRQDGGLRAGVLSNSTGEVLRIQTIRPQYVTLTGGSPEPSRPPEVLLPLRFLMEGDHLEGMLYRELLRSPGRLIIGRVRVLYHHGDVYLVEDRSFTREWVVEADLGDGEEANEVPGAFARLGSDGVWEEE